MDTSFTIGKSAISTPSGRTWKALAASKLGDCGQFGISYFRGNSNDRRVGAAKRICTIGMADAPRRRKLLEGNEYIVGKKPIQAGE